MGDVFKALADPTRRLLLDELSARNDQTLFELCARLVQRSGVNSSRQAVSQHLDVLEQAGLVAVRREGRYKFHHFDPLPLREIPQRWLTPPTTGAGMKIYLTSVMVSDQARALAFYTGVLGFEKKLDLPLGEHRWLTLTAPDDPNGVQLLLEPNVHPAAKPFQDALVDDGIPATSFAVDDVKAEQQRLESLGVRFTQNAATFGGVTSAVFDDTCGNLLQIVQLPAT